MNFFPGAKVVSEGDSIKIKLDNIGQVGVPPLHMERARAAAGKNLTFGLRPESFEDKALLVGLPENGSTLNATVDVVENLGSELLVYLTTGGKTVLARLNPRSDAHVGGNFKLKVDNEHIHLFDPDSGEAYLWRLMGKSHG